MARETIAGRYRLLEPLGGGSMGAVWLAEDAELGRRVAVKLLGPDADRARFEREARAAASLAHPNICQLFDYGEENGRPYMVLEYLPGGSLDDLIERGKPLPDDDTGRIARQIAQGLAHAHQRGLVHRDLKPANVLFDNEGHAKIADFGIARMRGSGTLTDAGTVLGTAAYISPEQARGEVATPASDVYSTGAILFLMLTGRLPFESPNAMALVAMHRDDAPPRVSDLRPDAPAELAATADASLAKRPADRPADGAALLAALSASPETAGTALMPALPLTGEQTQVIPRARPRPPASQRSVRSRYVVPVAVLVAVILLGAGATLAVVMTGDDSGNNSSPSVTLPVSNPTVSTATTEPTTAPTTTATTTEATTTEPTTTNAPTTAPTTAPATTAPPTTTIAPPSTTAPVTTAPPTTAPPATTTAPPTTDTTPATTDTVTLPLP